MYLAREDRYSSMTYRRSGKSGIQLPALSLGLWHNFGGADTLTNGRTIMLRAFDLGITHFDLANNYGPPPGSAESTFGQVLASDLGVYRDELMISTKAGYDMWPGPYGEWGSRKYLLASLDQSLRRMKLDYVDIFYSHRPDPNTPLEETMSALDQAVRSGKALYAAISNYDSAQTQRAIEILRQLGTPCLIHQVRYSMFDRKPEQGLFDVLKREQVGCIAFSPLAQGQLSDRYLNEIPADSRAARAVFLKPEQITPQVLDKIRGLGEIAKQRGQSLAQMAVAWALRNPVMTSIIVGASRVEQLEQNVAALERPAFSTGELDAIDGILAARAEVHA